MKKTAILLCVLLLAAVMTAHSEVRLMKKFELGTAVSFQAMHQEDWNSTWWNIPVRVGYFFTNWLEVEPEFILSKTDYYDDYPNVWSYLVNLNLSAHFAVAGQVFPFILVGAGVGNGIPVMGVVYGDSGIHASVFSIGAGLKYFVVSFGAVRVEYRFSRYRETYPVYPNIEEIVKGRMHQVFVGVSLFF
jgi:opacity protein-like surface antigen